MFVIFLLEKLLAQYFFQFTWKIFLFNQCQLSSNVFKTRNISIYVQKQNKDILSFEMKLSTFYLKLCLMYLI